MSEEMRIWAEISFNVLYLLAIWWLVANMWRRRPQVRAKERRVADLFLVAFALLALGDTGHVGFRVWAYVRGGLDAAVNLGSASIGLVGLGALATAVTVTFFYAVFLLVWWVRSSQTETDRRWLYGLLLVGGVRLLLMVPAANEWQSVVPPQPWGLIRNLPLMVLGLGVAYLLLRDARRMDDRPLWWIGLLILVSYAFYTPVVLFVQRWPLLGMLMIPKTLAYVGMAIIAYRTFFRLSDRREPVPPIAPQAS